MITQVKSNESFINHSCYDVTDSMSVVFCHLFSTAPSLSN